jgi:probable HAF family extracellular repeat protein
MRTIICTVFFAALAALPTPARAQSYTVTNLGSFGGRSEALSVNNAGFVAGYSATSDSDDELKPFLYDGNSLRDLTGSYGLATGINDAGQVTGFAQFPGLPNVRAFLYANGTMTILGALPGYSNQPYSTAQAISPSGIIVGESKAEPFSYFAGEMKGFSRRNARNAYGVNDSGQIVGMLSNNHAYLFTQSRMLDIGTLDGARDTVSLATAINARGQVVGYSTLEGNAITHAFSYDNGIMHDLGTLRGGYSYAIGINTNGDIVGESDGSAFLYRNGTMIDLNDVAAPTLGLLGLSRATSINDRGQIVGVGLFANEGDRAVLLTPVGQ